MLIAARATRSAILLLALLAGLAVGFTWTIHVLHPAQGGPPTYPYPEGNRAWHGGS